ncbi:hypothetical protein CMV_024808 [Castanea mollissima]|uniref:Disease resistance N-terminal domain-containing protein n=1 Tax=Castanea mollissima TaxID=60419 RepID=A0A8J4QEU1_9ROSI|nr:hypothetical protein CMV_024808 [Castanea mollissima]
MAEGALFNVAEGIIGQLGKVALNELELLRGVKEEHQKLVGTVSTIKAVILDAEEKQAQNETIKNWLGRLKDALYEADDLLDDFSTEVLRREVMTRNKKAKETLDIQNCPILVESCKSQDWVARIENLRGDLAPPKRRSRTN